MGMMLCPRCWKAGGPCDLCDGRGLVADVRLSEDFLLSELLRSDTARLSGTPNDPPPKVLKNLRSLAGWLLQPVRDRFGPLLVTSGYRAPEVNSKIPGASPGSAHASGWAADVRPLELEAVRIMRWLPHSGLLWDQAIYYGNRVHLGFKHPVSGVQRKELRIARGGEYPLWTP